MKKYKIHIIRNLFQECYINIEADNPNEANNFITMVEKHKMNLPFTEPKIYQGEEFYINDIYELQEKE